MSLKTGWVIVILLISFFPIFRFANAVDRAGDPNPDVPTSYVRGSDITTIKKIIGEKTPNFITQPVVTIAQSVEGFRQDMIRKSEGKFYQFIFSRSLIYYIIFTVIFFFLLRTIWRIIF
jgi:hypothetical protein